MNLSKTGRVFLLVFLFASSGILITVAAWNYTSAYQTKIMNGLEAIENGINWFFERRDNVTQRIRVECNVEIHHTTQQYVGHLLKKVNNNEQLNELLASIYMLGTKTVFHDPDTLISWSIGSLRTPEECRRGALWWVSGYAYCIFYPSENPIGYKLEGSNLQTHDGFLVNGHIALIIGAWLLVFPVVGVVCRNKNGTG